MRGAILGRCASGALAVLTGACGTDIGVPELTSAPADFEHRPLFAAAPADVPLIPPTRTVNDALNSGVVIVVSKATQQMHVFRNGSLWKSSRVSTGKTGKETPSGVFAILQKKEFHRSNLYSNAPMPFMQRLTWDGIAIHAGAVPNYPASHGCIRVPLEFATELYGVTGPVSTAVIVVDQALASDGAALALARRTDAAIPIHPSLLWQKPRAQAAADPARPAQASSPRVQPQIAQLNFARLQIDRPEIDPKRSGREQTPIPPANPRAKAGDQTIQLVAAYSHAEAKAQWQTLTRQRPELAQMRMAIVPATVNAQQYYRLRVSAPDAHSRCDALKNAGVACFPVS